MTRKPTPARPFVAVAIQPAEARAMQRAIAAQNLPTQH